MNAHAIAGANAALAPKVWLLLARCLIRRYSPLALRVASLAINAPISSSRSRAPQADSDEPLAPRSNHLRGKSPSFRYCRRPLIQRIFQLAQNPDFGARIAFVEDYDHHLAQRMVRGVDIWLNNPVPPLEASGTSGMKASMNGVPNLSILDGWWMEVTTAQRLGHRWRPGGNRSHRRRYRSPLPPAGGGNRSALLPVSVDGLPHDMSA